MAAYIAPARPAQEQWRWEDALRGVIPPMISPLHPKQTVDARAIGRMVDYILAGGCSGLFVLGGVGLGAWLDASQRESVVRSTVEAARGRAPVLAGVMLPGTAPARDAARQAEASGADALVVGSPYYMSVTAADQQRHIEAVLRATSVPVVLYNIPQCTHAPLALACVEALGAEPRVLAIKDSWGNLPYFEALLALKRKRPSFRVLQGSEHAASASMLLGADGLIPGLANVAPRLLVDLVHAAQRGDALTCRQLHDKVVRLADVYASAGIAGLYRACALLGLASGHPAEPWTWLDDAAVAPIEGALREYGLMPRVGAAAD